MTQPYIQSALKIRKPKKIHVFSPRITEGDTAPAAPAPAPDVTMGEEGAGGVRVTAPPVIEKKKGLLGKKCETLSPFDVVPIMRSRLDTLQ